MAIKKLLSLILISMLHCITAVAKNEQVDEPTLGKSTKATKDLLEANIENEPTLRYTQTQQGIGLHGGIIAAGYKGMLEWSYHFLTDLQLKVLLGGEWKNKGNYSGNGIRLIKITTRRQYFRRSRKPQNKLRSSNNVLKIALFRI